jgi:cell division protein ZapA
MAQVSAHIAGRNYPLACRDGDEPHLLALAAGLDAKAQALTSQLGTMAEQRLLLMVALMIADELHEARNGNIPVPAPAIAAPDPALVGWLEAMTARVEALATTLEQNH